MALLQSAIFDTQDLAEAISAWHEKRPGRFDALSPLTTRQTASVPGNHCRPLARPLIPSRTLDDRAT
ncbi:hypothetical protein [Burkholderia sp. Bp8963]|uniref:hypothetical protein n=1 Tax=Burkholderia sp. Bp8963 TaxID=2184547 RepID=UPI00163A16BD|nr:hypothetical protein [Burkholderia sp. Bp8963]